MSLPAMIEHAQSEEDVRALQRKRLQLAVPAILPTGARSAIVHDISVGGLLLETDSSMSIGEASGAEIVAAESEDRLDRGDLSTAARIQIVVAISAFFWALIVAAIALF